MTSKAEKAFWSQMEWWYDVHVLGMDTAYHLAIRPEEFPDFIVSAQRDGLPQHVVEKFIETAAELPEDAAMADGYALADKVKEDLFAFLDERNELEYVRQLNRVGILDGEGLFEEGE